MDLFRTLMMAQELVEDQDARAVMSPTQWWALCRLIDLIEDLDGDGISRQERDLLEDLATAGGLL